MPAWTRPRGSLEKLLDLAARDEAAGLGDAPWPPHFRKMAGEASARRAVARQGRGEAAAAQKMPLVVVANSPDKAGRARRPRALEGEAPRGRQATSPSTTSWSMRMRGRSSTWTRIRVNLRNVPEAIRPPQETPDPDDDPTREWRELRANLREAGEGDA